MRLCTVLPQKLSGMLLSVDRGIKKGPHLARINERVNHTHQRMAREHGDLSSDLNIHFSTVRSFPPFSSHAMAGKAQCWLSA